MRRLEAPLLDRWLAKVEKTDGCWFWRGALKETGYGVIQRGRRGEGHIRAHVFAYQHFVGPIPAGHDVRHTCHVRHCVNPDHLTTGSRQANMRDMVEAGRWTPREPLRGERNGFAKLTVADVLRIRIDPRPSQAVAAEYGVNSRTIRSVRERRTWGHVQDQ